MPETLTGPSYSAWVCGCKDGRLWDDAPRHLTCADCGRVIRQTELVPASTAAFYKHERDRLAAPSEGDSK